jgi:putative FmdB family regulatory protein
MPIYVYRCAHCGLEKEVLQKVSEASLIECPSCHQLTFNKKLTAAGFQLKGSGWYETDFKNKPKEAAASDSATTAGKTGDCPAAN